MLAGYVLIALGKLLEKCNQLLPKKVMKLLSSLLTSRGDNLHCVLHYFPFLITAPSLVPLNNCKAAALPHLLYFKLEVQTETLWFNKQPGYSSEVSLASAAGLAPGDCRQHSRSPMGFKHPPTLNLRQASQLRRHNV